MNFLTANVVIDVNMKKLAAQLAKARTVSTRTATMMQKSFKRMGRVLSRVFRVAARAAKWASLAILGVGIASVKMAMDAEESENLFEVSMGRMADAARKWSKEMSDALYLNEYEVRKVIGTFNVMFDSMGLGTKAAYDMATGLTQLSYDMASFYNLKPAEAFQKLQAGITGEAEPLKRLGILINETTVKQYALNKGLWDGVGVMTELEKVQARYGLILEQTTKAQGDMERTLDSSTNVFRSLWSLIKETSIGIGERLLPAITEAGIVFRDWLSENQNTVILAVVKGIKSMIEAIRYVTKEIKLIPAYWNQVRIEVTKVSISIWKVADAMTNLDEVFAWIRGDTETYKNIIQRLEKEVEQLETKVVDLTQAYVDGNVVVDEFFESLVSGLENASKAPDFMTTFPEVVKFEQQPFSWETPKQQLDVVKEMAKAEDSRAESALKNYDAMRSALEFELEHLGEIDDLRERAATYAQVELETNEMLNLSAEERNQKLTEYMELFDKLQEKQASFGHNIQLWMNQQKAWGKNLATIVTNSFDTMADGLADALMGMTMDWKAFGLMFIKQILSMIIKMQMLYVWQQMTGFAGSFSGGGGGGGANASYGGGSFLGPDAASGMAEGGTVTKTGWAKVDKGEVFSGVNNEMGFGNITINNNASDVVEVETMTEERVINISRRTSMQSAASDGAYRRSHGLGN